MKKTKQKKWIRPQHKLFRELIYTFFVPHVKRKYGVEVEKFKEQEKGKSYLILFNHQTAYDQFIVGMAFDGPGYYVASEDLFSLGFLSKIIKWAVAPIPIKKQTTDVGAVLTCKRVVKEGGTIALAPEGNRTYSGKTEHINPAIAGLAKLLKLPIVFYRIEGGYGVHPRWADEARKGNKVRGYVSRVMEVDEYIKLDNDALNDIIKKELYVDDTQYETVNNHKKLAEYLERAIYVCPKCGLAEFESNGDIIECKKCHLKVQYMPDKKLKGANAEIPFEFVKDWYDYQVDFMSKLDLSSFADKPIFTDKSVKLFNVILYKKKKVIDKKASITAFNDRIELAHKKCNVVLPFDDITAVTVLGKNKLNIYTGESVYQIKGGKRMNAIKYVNLYYHYVNVKDGNENGRFLGL